MFADHLMTVGRAMVEPVSRYAILSLRPEHLQAHAGPYDWTGTAWRVVCDMADQDEREGKSRRLVPERLHSVCDSIPLKQWRHLEFIGQTPEAALEQLDASHRLIERWQVGRLYQLGSDITAKGGFWLAEGRAEEGHDLLSQLRTMLADAEHELAANAPGQVVASGEEQAQRFLAHQEEVRQHPEDVLGVMSGGTAWDRVHRGALPGRTGLTVAPTGSGKTFKFLNLATQLCDGGMPGLYIDNEMMKDEQDNRLACIRLNRAGFCDDRGDKIFLDRMARGDYGPALELEAASMAEASGLMLTDNSPKTALQIAALLAQYAVRNQIRWACIDHMLDVEMTKEERREGPQWKQHRRWLGLWQGVARKYGFTLEVIGMVGGENIVARDGVEPNPYELQGAKATINRVDYFRVLWRSEDGDPVVTTCKNRSGADWQRVRYAWDRPTGLMKEKLGGFYEPPQKDEKGGGRG